MDNQSSGTPNSPSTYSDSSKTGSSKSGASDADKNRDLTRDNAASPIDLECHIQCERITKILDEAIYKTKLAICLPALVHEYNTLYSKLSEQHMEDLIFIFEQYDNPLFSASLLNMAALEDLRAGDVSLKNRLNPELGHLLYIMNSYPVLKPKVEEMIAELKSEQGHGDYHKSQNAALTYLQKLEHFRQIMKVQMETTAAEELDAKITTRKLESSNLKLIANIKETTATLKEESEAFEKMIAQKTETIKKLEQELAFLHHDANINLKKQILDSDRQMVLQSRSHAVKMEMIKEEEVETKEAYESLLRRHLAEEKNLRARRFKVETQLLSWVQKYDTEMSDKQEELDDFTSQYEDEMKKCEDLEIQLAEQDKEYIPLMEEREKEYHEEMTRKMEEFVLEHSARIIQKAWRDVLKNRAEKSKLRKLIAKAKAAAEAEAARQARIAAKEAKAAAKAKKEAAKLAKEEKKREREAKKLEKQNQAQGEQEEEKEKE